MQYRTLTKMVYDGSKLIFANLPANHESQSESTTANTRLYLKDTGQLRSSSMSKTHIHTHSTPTQTVNEAQLERSVNSDGLEEKHMSIFTADSREGRRPTVSTVFDGGSAGQADILLRLHRTWRHSLLTLYRTYRAAPWLTQCTA